LFAPFYGPSALGPALPIAGPEGGYISDLMELMRVHGISRCRPEPRTTHLEHQNMYLSRPTQAVFVIAVLLAIAALLIFLNILPFVAIPSFWIMTTAFVLLLLGNLVKGM
jgi:hypothetical protein